MALLITLLLGAFFMLGAVIIKIFGDDEIIEHSSVAAALGALICIAATDIIPDILEDYSGYGYIAALLFCAAGTAALMLLDRFVPDHESGDGGEESTMVHIGVMSMIAISIHNIVEGMTVYSMASQSPAAGLSLSVGVGLHNIPMGMLIFSTLRSGSRRKKYFVMGIASLSTFVGGLIMQLITGLIPHSSLRSLECIALGMVVYIVVFELLPSVIHDRKWSRTLLWGLIGAAFVAASLFFE